MDKKKLIERLPEHLQKVREFGWITDAEQEEVETMWKQIEDFEKDQFVAEATETGIARYEKIYSVTPQGVGTLEERRFRVLTKITEKLPYSLKMLKNQLSALCGSDGYSLSVEDYTLSVCVELGVKSNFEAVKKLIYSACPSNLVLNVYLKYNQHSLFGAYTHENLKTYTHYQMRNEVLNDGE